jgi:hypothetical protein
MLLDAGWAAAFAFTQAVETPVYAIALRSKTLPARLAIAFGASLLTHPVVWTIVRAGSADDYWQQTAIAELFAVCFEAGYLRLFAVPGALAWSVFANASSMGLGLLVRSVWGIV